MRGFNEFSKKEGRVKDLYGVILKDVENIFWEAMEHGWSSGAETLTAPFLPGYKCIPFESGNFRVEDAYSTGSPTGKSAGFTIIWFNDIPVWTMNYGGQYPKEAIPFLKLALQSAIAKKTFMGGRGPYNFEHESHPGLIYHNYPEDSLCFSDFSGLEEIYKSGRRIGYHKYSGMLLI
jgi:hypothetical protein